MKQIILILCLGIASVAQSQNLIPNGGFEEYTSSGRPKYWYFHRDLSFGRSSEAHSGQYAAKIYPTGAFFNPTDNKYEYIEVQSNAEYTLTYWYKGVLSQENLEPTVQWYDASDKLIKSETLGRITANPSVWQKKEVTLMVPSGIKKVNISFRLRADNNNNAYLLLDDFSLTYKGSGSVTLTKPTNFRAQAFQREILLTWDKEADTDLQWEIVVDNQAPKRVGANSFLATGLPPETEHSFKVRTVKGASASAYTNIISQKTNAMLRQVTDKMRIPHLRTLNANGNCPQTIDLFYNDLADSSAQIKYYINGVETSPHNQQLTFPSKGKQKLKIHIVETTDRQWELEYQLNVQ